MKGENHRLWLYAVMIIIAAALASHEFPTTGYTIQEGESVVNAEAPVAVQEVAKSASELKVSAESLGYVVLLVLLIGGIYFVMLVERLRVRMFSKKKR